ncbi:MAG: C25 family cysteine peptidase [Methanobacteriota archaeon]
MIRGNNKSIVQYKASIIVLIMLLASAPFFTTGSSNTITKDQDLTLSYSFERPTINEININGAIYNQIQLNNAPCTGTTGQPYIPARSIYLLIPQGKTVNDITITHTEKTFLGSGYTVEPAGVPIPTSQEQDIVSLVPDITIYGSNEPYPNTCFQMVCIQQCKGYTILVGQLFPVEYNPSTGRLWYYPEITISISTKEKPTDTTMLRGFETDRSDILSKVDNPEVERTYSDKQQVTLTKYDLLILTTQELKSGFKRLVDAHKRQGVRTTIKTLESIGASTPEDIRAYLQQAYQDLGITYVLIGGDNDVVPAKFLYFGSYYGPVYGPSDLYYACLDGPFNSDGDEKWGERNDGENGGEVDLMAEVYVGRACVGNLTEVGNFVNKTIAYMTVNINDNYLKNALMVGQYMCGPLEGMPLTFGDDYMEELIDKSTHNGYNTIGIPPQYYRIIRLYDGEWPGWNWTNPWSTGWPVGELIAQINSGVHIINHLGHSERFYNMKMETYWDLDDIDALTNTKYCFIYSQGCSAGAFDRNSSNINPDCIAEYFTVKRPTGAFAGIWNAREGWYMPGGTDSPSQRYHRWFWDGVFHRGNSVLSKANQYSKEMNIAGVHTSQTMRWCCFGLNYLGDPAVAIINRPVYLEQNQITDI